jgi:hypothetical protein
VVLKTLFSPKGKDVIATKYTNYPIPTIEDIQKFSKTNAKQPQTMKFFMYLKI